MAKRAIVFCVKDSNLIANMKPTLKIRGGQKHNVYNVLLSFSFHDKIQYIVFLKNFPKFHTCIIFLFVFLFLFVCFLFVCFLFISAKTRLKLLLNFIQILKIVEKSPGPVCPIGMHNEGLSR